MIKNLYNLRKWREYNGNQIADNNNCIAEST